MKLALVILVSAICALVADQAKFETASVKNATQCTFDTSLDPGLVTLKGIPLQPVLLQAFKVKADQVEGGPAWLESDCFDIVAKMPQGATMDQMPAMLQTLLAERFQLTTHKENRQRQGYALVVDKGGSKLKEDDPAANFMPAGRGTLMIGRSGVGRFKTVTTMAGLASYLTNRLGNPVVDETGLTAKYDIDLSWTPDATLERGRGATAPPGVANPTAPDPGADLPTALRETLGLKLERRTVPLEVVVIDHIERVPTGN